MLPILRQPNAATARSSLPSPLKSAASTSATRGQPSSHIATELPVAEPAHPDHRAVVVIGGKELAQVGDQQILDAVFVEIHRRHVIGMWHAGAPFANGR